MSCPPTAPGMAGCASSKPAPAMITPRSLVIVLPLKPTLYRRTPGVPLAGLLVGMREGEHDRLAQRRPADLQPDRQARFGEAARNRDGGQAVDVERGSVAERRSRARWDVGQNGRGDRFRRH